MKFSKMTKQQYISLSVNVLLVIVCIIILMSMFFLRPSGALFPDSESYFNLRMANNFNFYDSLSYDGRYSAYQLGLPLVLQMPFLAYFLPGLCGFLCFILLWKIMLKFNFNTNWTKISLALFILSPPFIYLFSTLNKHFFALFMAMLAFYLFLQEQRWKLYASIALTMLLPFFSFMILVSYLAILSLYVFFKDKFRKQTLLLILGLTGLSFFLNVILLFILGGWPELFLFSLNGLGIYTRLLIAEIGSHYGLSIFSVVAAVIGISSLWKRKYNNLFIFFSFLSLILLTLVRSEFVYILNIFVCIFAAKGFLHFFNKKWESKTLQQFVLLILFCGIVFSTVAHLDKLDEALPNAEIVEAFDFFENEAEPGVVFSHYTRGHWITYSGHSNVMDENFLFAPNVNERWVDSNAMLSYRLKEDVLQLIDKYNIKYVWLDKEMKDLVWNSEEEGLFFVLKYDKTSFEKVFENDFVEIWRVS